MKKILKGKSPYLFKSLSFIKAAFIGVLVNFQERGLIEDITSFHKSNNDTEEVVSFLNEHGLHMVPYFFIKEYRNMEVVLYYNHEN